MVNNLDKVIASLRFLELRPNIQEYKWRFLVQKTAYLAQALGLGTDYYFTAYVAGPYSPTLAKDYYSNAEKIDMLTTDYQLTTNETELLQRIKACCDLYHNLSLMECTATVVYVMKEMPEIRDFDLLAKIKMLKPFLNDSIHVIGISKAKELLFKQEYLDADLKREIDEWDNSRD
jgi:uncharacterized protein YwgA